MSNIYYHYNFKVNHRREIIDDCISGCYNPQRTNLTHAEWIRLHSWVDSGADQIIQKHGLEGIEYALHTFADFHHNKFPTCSREEIELQAYRAFVQFGIGALDEFLKSVIKS